MRDSLAGSDSHDNWLTFDCSLVSSRASLLSTVSCFYLTLISSVSFYLYLETLLASFLPSLTFSVNLPLFFAPSIGSLFFLLGLLPPCPCTTGLSTLSSHKSSPRPWHWACRSLSTSPCPGPSPAPCPRTGSWQRATELHSGLELQRSAAISTVSK